MLNLSVSTQPCVPGRPQGPSLRQRPERCETCGAPGGAGGVLLEEHIVTAGKAKYLCPLCHSCLHLDVAGRKKAGRVIWLPEIPQAQLNIMCLSMFVAFSKAGVNRKNEQTKGVTDCAARFYQAFEKRAEPVEVFLGGSAVKSLMPRSSLSSPTHIASLLVRSQREAKLSAKTMAARVDGLRLLPAPKAFDDYIGKVSRIVASKAPVNTWAPRVLDALQALERAATENGAAEGVEHFDAEPIQA